MHICVTGAVGDVGSRVVPELSAGGDAVTCIDRRTVPGQASPNVLLDIAKASPETLLDAFQSHDALIHLAAVPGAATPDETFGVNVFGTWKVLDAAAQAGIKRVVLTSSAPVHLDQGPDVAGNPLRTGTDGDRVYDISKRLQESLAEDFAEHGLSVVCLRLGHVVDAGSGVDLEGAPLAGLDYCRGGWVDIADVARAVAAAARVAVDTGFTLLHVIGDARARDRYDIARTELALGISISERFAQYQETALE